MKKVIMTSLLIMVLAVIALGYVPTPVTTVPPTVTGNPQVMLKKTLYKNTEVTFSIDVEDANDDTLTVTAQGGTVTKGASVYVGSMTVTDANGTAIIPINKTTYSIKFKPSATGYLYPEIAVTDSDGARDIKYIELDVRKKNVAPVITGCRSI